MGMGIDDTIGNGNGNGKEWESFYGNGNGYYSHKFPSADAYVIVTYSWI